MVAGGTATDHFHGTDFDQAVPEVRFEAGGLRIEDDLPHATSPFAWQMMAWSRAATSTRSFSTWPL